MDRKAIAAVALCVLALIFWRPLMKQLGLGPYVEPQRPRVATVDTTGRDSLRAGVLPPPASPAQPSGLAEVPAPGVRDTTVRAEAPSLSRRIAPEPAQLARSITLETPLYKATFSDRGARLLSVELKRYASAHGASLPHGRLPGVEIGEEVPSGDRVVLSGDPLMALDLGSGSGTESLADLTYAVTESLGADGERRAVTFEASEQGLHLRQTYRIRPEDYAIDLAVEILAVPAEWRLSEYTLTARSWPLFTEEDLDAESRSLRSTSLVGTNFHNDHAAGLLKGPKVHEGNVSWAAVQTRYFIGAIVVGRGTPRSVISRAERRPVTPEEAALMPPNARPEQPVAINSVVVGLPPASDPVHRFVLYSGPNQHSRLASLGHDLERAVDLGWSWVRPFSKALLWMLTSLFALVRNYGLAIVLLATAIRLLLHPLNMMSMKSMRAMQKLQPEMTRIREKYKSDPQAMNAAVMALYKDNKVNPAGGCLPMLLQMPVFIALYQVLYNAIELRQAPFVAWMNDLSAPDLLFSVGPFPVRVLPILMLGSGLLSQKLTPTDPRQMTTMYLMNVVMLVFFYNLPSGLVLYWTVMNLLTALQQWLVLRQDGHPPVAAPAVEPARVGGKKRRNATR